MKKNNSDDIFASECCSRFWVRLPGRTVWRRFPNVQVGNRYRFTSNPDGVLSPSAVAEIDSLCYSLRHRALAQVAVVAVEDIRGDDLFSFAHTLFFPNGVSAAPIRTTDWAFSWSSIAGKCGS